MGGKSGSSTNVGEHGHSNQHQRRSTQEHEGPALLRYSPQPRYRELDLDSSEPNWADGGHRQVPQCPEFRARGPRGPTDRDGAFHARCVHAVRRRTWREDRRRRRRNVGAREGGRRRWRPALRARPRHEVRRIPHVQRLRRLRILRARHQSRRGHRPRGARRYRRSGEVLGRAPRGAAALSRTTSPGSWRRASRAAGNARRLRFGRRDMVRAADCLLCAPKSRFPSVRPTTA